MGKRGHKSGKGPRTAVPRRMNLGRWECIFVLLSGKHTRTFWDKAVLNGKAPPDMLLPLWECPRYSGKCVAFIPVNTHIWIVWECLWNSLYFHIWLLTYLSFFFSIETYSKWGPLTFYFVRLYANIDLKLTQLHLGSELVIMLAFHWSLLDINFGAKEPFLILSCFTWYVSAGLLKYMLSLKKNYWVNDKILLRRMMK